MKPVRSLVVVIACAALAGAPVRAQEAVGPPAAADDPAQVSELVVVAHPQGPACGVCSTATRS